MPQPPSIPNSPVLGASLVGPSALSSGLSNTPALLAPVEGPSVAVPILGLQGEAAVSLAPDVGPKSAIDSLRDLRLAAASAAEPVALFAGPNFGAAELAAVVPPKIQAFIRELEEWALGNQRDAKRDAWRFWAYKIPAILTSVIAAALALAGIQDLTPLLSAVATACVLLDAVYPGGQLRNAHMSAFHRIRALENEIRDKCLVNSFQGRTRDQHIAAVLQSALITKKKIIDALHVAETSFGGAAGKS